MNVKIHVAVIEPAEAGERPEVVAGLDRDEVLSRAASRLWTQLPLDRRRLLPADPVEDPEEFISELWHIQSRPCVSMHEAEV